MNCWVIFQCAFLGANYRKTTRRNLTRYNYTFYNSMTTSLGDGRLGLSTVAVNSNIIDYDEGTNKYEYVRVFEKNNM